MRFRSCDTCCVSWRFLCLNDCARLRSHPLSRTAYCLQWRATACAMQASVSASTSASTLFLGIHVHTDPRTGASTSVSTHTTLLLFGRLVGHGTAKVWSNRRSSHHTPSSCRRLWRSPLRPPCLRRQGRSPGIRSCGGEWGGAIGAAVVGCSGPGGTIGQHPGRYDRQTMS